MADDDLEPQRDLSPVGLYSHASEVADRLPQMKGTPQQFAAMLQKQGVKPDELKHSGYDDTFKDQKLITRNQLAQHFKSKMPKVQETVLGGGDKPTKTARDLAAESGDDWDDLGPNGRQRYQDAAEQPATKYHAYTLPGGKNYREVLLHLPQDTSLRDKHNEINSRFEKIQDEFDALHGNDTPEAAQRRAALAAEKERVHDDLAKLMERGPSEHKNYVGPHWDDTPNVLAHLRMSDRTGPKGEKILHLEELQSDWAQEGRKKGFKRGPLAPHETAELEAMDDRRAPNGDFTGFSPTEHQRYLELNRVRNGDAPGVPPAPYVDSTQKWVDLGLKRVLHEAAKGGYDKVVVTPGEEQAARYDLSKHIDKISYDGKRLWAWKKNSGTPDINQAVKPDELASHIGKEAAERLMQQPDQKMSGFTPGGGTYKTLEGADLKIGGEGMKAFYDKVVPAALEKLAKKHDPQARVGRSPIYKGRQIVKGDAPPAPTMGHSLTITPEMRKSILRGHPAFKKGGKVEGDEEQLALPFRERDLKPAKAGYKDLPPPRGKLQFVPGLDQIFGKHSSAAVKDVRKHTEKTGREGLVYGERWKRSPLIGGTNNFIDVGDDSPFRKFGTEATVPFFSVHTHPSGAVHPSRDDMMLRNDVGPRLHHMMIEAMGAPHNRTVVAPSRGLVPAGPLAQPGQTPGVSWSNLPWGRGQWRPYQRIKDLNKAMGTDPEAQASLSMLINERLARRGVPMYMDKRARLPGTTQGTIEEMLPEYLEHLQRHGELEDFASGGGVEGHPARIPTRLVTSKKNPSEPHHNIDMESFRADPKLFAKNMELVRSYPNMRESVARKGTHEQLASEFIRHAKDNLLALHDAVPEKVRNRSKLWYTGARNIIDKWSKDYGLPDHSIAGALAALSPQKDWYQNVSLAKRVLDVMRGSGGNYYNGFATSPEMEKKFKATPTMKQYRQTFDLIRGKTLADIDRLEDMSPQEKLATKALWVRMHDEAHNDRAHQIVSPEGGFGENVKTKGGKDAGTGWGSLGEISKAIAAIEAGNDPARLSGLMGERHKVRNFYNNMLDPDGPGGDVTIDTHAVAAGLYRPLSGNSLEVSHNFANHPGKGLPAAGGSAITGVQGLYPLYAEAYRQAAKERGILPREMQSITWEAIRGLYPDTFKTKANNGMIDNVWREYRQGKISQKRAREKIHAIAGRIRNPTWFSGDDAEERHPSYTGELPAVGLRGGPAEGAVGRAGSGPAGSFPAASPRAPVRSPGSQIGLISPEGTFARGGAIESALRVARRTR